MVVVVAVQAQVSTERHGLRSVDARLVCEVVRAHVELLLQVDLADGCGLSGWKENIPLDVDGRTCAAITFAGKGETLFDRAWIDGNRLRFAAFPVKWSNRSPDDRPQSPIETVYYRTSY